MSIPWGLAGLIAGTPTTPQTVTVTATVSDGVLSTARSFGWTVQAPIAFAGLTADRVAPRPANTPITFTAAARDARWDRWQILRDWTTSRTFTWTPPTANAAYRINVWVRNADSAMAEYDADASMTFAIR